MAFPPGFLDELRTRISLAELVGRRVRLTRRGREYVGLCPFHNEKTPSFCVVEDKGFFHCFGCGAHGDAIGYVMRADNVDFVEAIERLAGVAGLAIPKSTPQERERAQRQKTLMEAMQAAAEFYEKRLWSPFGRIGLEYLRARGLDDETIRRFRLGWAPEDRQSLRRVLAGEYPEPMLLEAGLVRASDRGGDPYDYFGNRVMFPISDRAGRVIAFGARTIGDDQPKYLNSPDTPLFEKGRVLYAWAAARAQIGREGDFGGDGVPGGVIVTEGYMDVIALHRAGFATAVAPLGTALTETQLQELWRLAPEPVLCFDGNSAGQRAAFRALNRALPLLKPGRSLRFAVLPPGEDPNSLIRARGAGAFAEVLAAARPLVEILWQSELAERPIDTPERRADLKSRLERRARDIVDGEVQREYRRVLTDRYYELTRGGQDFRQGRDFRDRESRSGQRRFQPLRVEAPPPPPIPGRAHRQIFLGLLLRHPALIGDWVEELAEIEMPEPDLDRLQHEILQNCEAFAGLDAERLEQHLGSCGFADAVGALARAIAAHAGFATGGEDDPEVIRNGLSETLVLLRAQAPGDLDAAEHAFAADASDENWQRLKALKEREAEDGPVGGLNW